MVAGSIRFSRSSGSKRQQDARRITTRRGDQARGLDFLRADFRQAVNRLRQQIRRRMRVTVEFLIDRRVAQAEIRAQVDHLQAALQQGAGDFRRHAVRQREKRRLRSGRRDRVRIRLDERQLRTRCLAKSRKHRAQRFARLLRAR